MSSKGGGPGIGIDLGTTNSCVGEIMIPNDQGNQTCFFPLILFLISLSFLGLNSLCVCFFW